MRKRTGFTLVELLVVIAIIGLLVALTLPAVLASRQAADVTVCANNMRQIGLAIAMFANNNDGAFPQTYHAGDDQSWIYTLAPYVENVDKIRACPRDPLAEQRLANKGTSYVISAYVSFSVPGAILNRDHLRATSQTITVFEGAETRDPKSFYFEHAHPENWFSPGNINKKLVWIKLLQEIQPDRHWSNSSGDRSAGVANYLYADGHVATIPSATIKGYADSGDNFALPQ